jgi:cell fate regulator YaaT (PSP1 superfamily)
VQDAKDIKEFEEFKAPLKSVARVATKEDLKAYKDNLVAAEKAFEICKNLVNELKLDMRLLKAEYTLDATKVIIIYVSDNRVDFRELLKELAAKLKCRIELRQIGTRDRSKIVGGIGVCGLPLCCNSFLGEFDGISINMAKNQFLALNIQKLSGHCGKLICCLKYEDEQYTELRKGLPKVGFRLRYDNQQFKITSINILTRQVRLENPEAIIALPLDDVMKLYQEQVGEKKNDK